MSAPEIRAALLVTTRKLRQLNGIGHRVPSLKRGIARAWQQVSLQDVKAPPKVFVSYSHDSPEHKAWVRQLSEQLRTDGVDVLLDQWEVGLGGDVAAFMEHGLGSADRVILVCSESYIHKANNLKGGTGFERMIVTAEVAKDLKTRKFIPLIRNAKDPALPSFIGHRIYADFRDDVDYATQYDELLREIWKTPKHVKPPLGSSPYDSSLLQPPTHTPDTAPHPSFPSQRPRLTPTREHPMRKNDAWNYYWHPAVHEYCGNTLHLIFVRYGTNSIVFKPSIISDLRISGIHNYMIFELYSEWDILIRAWADEEAIESFRDRLSNNPDLHRDKQPDILRVHKRIHIRDEGSPPDSEATTVKLNAMAIEDLQNLQEEQEQSVHFETCKEDSIILSDLSAFDPARIQHYVTIRSATPLAPNTVTQLVERIFQHTNIKNKTVYSFAGAATNLIVKGQVDQEHFYDIYSFLTDITGQLKDKDVVTETILVASPPTYVTNTIDFEKAKKVVRRRQSKELERRVAGSRTLSYEDEVWLHGKFVESARSRLKDPNGVLFALLGAKLNKSTDEVRQALTFFPPFEHQIRDNLARLIMALYEEEWTTIADELKRKEGIKNDKKLKDLTLGDLCKMVKRIIIDRKPIDISPLSEEEFSSLMDDAGKIRNRFAHTGGDLSSWDETFNFCVKFIPIYADLLEYIETVRRKSVAST